MRPPHRRDGADVAVEAGQLIIDVVSRLPALPPVIRYYDEFDDATRSIPAPADATVFEL